MTVSIIIPAYVTNSKALGYFEECIASVKGQADEIVVCDDGSPIPLHSFSDPTYHIKVLSGSHVGKSHARNVAAESSESELLYPLDADDLLIPNAIDMLTERWNSVPLYSDLIKIIDGKDIAYPLTNFDCGEIQIKCLSSVNVLHSKDQWESTGGWSEEINLLEDWEYNARLFWIYGALKVSLPLVKYRIHSDQSTSIPRPTKKLAWQRAKEMIDDFVRRNDMAGCCGKRTKGSRRSTPTTRSIRPATVSTAALDMSLEANMSDLGPTDQGKIWAKYVGGRGMGPHNKRGHSSRRKVYQRVKYGGTYQIWKEDTITEEQFRNGSANCGFIAIAPKATAAPAPAPVHAAPLKDDHTRRTPINVVRRTVGVGKALPEYASQMASMSISELKSMLDKADLNADDLLVLLEAEKHAKNRVGAIKLIEKQIARLSS